jgi:hypothetical protein
MTLSRIPTKQQTRLSRESRYHHGTIRIHKYFFIIATIKCRRHGICTREVTGDRISYGKRIHSKGFSHHDREFSGVVIMTEITGKGSNGKDSTKTANHISPPSINLPKGGGAIRGMGEKFAANPVTGTGSMTVPIATSPGRSGFGPQLSLSYDSGAGNGPFGFGWSLSLPSITRKTDKGLPKYLAGCGKTRREGDRSLPRSVRSRFEVHPCGVPSHCGSPLRATGCVATLSAHVAASTRLRIRTRL